MDSVVCVCVGGGGGAAAAVQNTAQRKLDRVVRQICL